MLEFNMGRFARLRVPGIQILQKTVADKARHFSIMVQQRSLVHQVCNPACVYFLGRMSSHNNPGIYTYSDTPRVTVATEDEHI